MEIKLTKNEVSIIIMCLNSTKFYDDANLEYSRQTLLSKLIDEKKRDDLKGGE